MIQSNHSTASRAVFTSAWIEFCRTGEGQHEYWRRFGDYLFTQPSREIPGELLSLPPMRRPRSCPRRRRTLRPPETITSTAPLRLDVVAQLAFPDGSMTASGLRREGRRGHLVIERIAGKDFTTLQHIEDMRLKCRNQQKAQGSGSNPKSVTPAANSSTVLPGSSVMDRVRSARAALQATAKALNETSPTTSHANTKHPAKAVVLPLKSSSSMS